MKILPAQEVVLVGGGNSTCEEGLRLTKFAGKVTLLVRGDRLSASQILINKEIHPAAASIFIPEYLKRI